MPCWVPWPAAQGSGLAPEAKTQKTNIMGVVPRGPNLTNLGLQIPKKSDGGGAG